MRTTRRILATLALGGVTACSYEDAIVVGLVPLPDAGASDAHADVAREETAVTADAWCADPPEPGPEGYVWCTVAQSASSASWVTAPAAALASVRAESSDFNYAGMAALFTDPPSLVELGAYDQLVFQADVPSGQTFEVFIGESPGVGCTYVVSGAGEARYVVDLGSPFWCWPSLCGHDLRATGLMFRTHWRTGMQATLTVRSIELVADSGPVGTVNALGASTGPGGYCWFAFAWDSGSASWVVPPSSGLAHVHAGAPAQASAGMGLQLPDAPVDLTAYSRIEVEGTVGDGVAFDISAVVADTDSEPRSCAWSQTGEGTSLYTADLTDRSGCWGDPRFDLTDTWRIELTKPWAEDADLDMSVTAIRWVP